MNTNRIRVLVVSQAIAMLLCMAASPHDAYASASNRIVVSLGDSYSSGEGNPPFYGQDEVKGFYDSELGKRVSGALDEEHPYAFQNDESKSANAGAARTITEDDDLGLWLALEDYYAHRSTISWPGQLVVGGTTLSESRYRDVGRDAQWFFYASTGAVAKNVYETRQDDKDGLSGGVRVQLEAAKGDLAGRLDDVAYVTMTIGGNDIGFADIVKEVAARNAFIDRDYLFNAMNASWKKFDGHERYVDTGKSKLIFVKDEGKGADLRKDQILECYRRVGDAFPNAQIVVAGYPTLMNDDRFEEIARLNEGNAFERALALWKLRRSRTHEPLFWFSSWEGWFVNQNAREFNRALRNLVDEANEAAKTDRFHFVSVEEAFDGHEAYTGEGSLINGIKVWDSERPSDIDMSYSFHPNKDGIAAYRDAVQKKMEELEDERPLVAYLDKESPEDLLKDYQSSLGVRDYSVDYSWQMITYPTMSHRWVVGEGIPDGAALGSELRDFDGDGDPELLVVRWSEGNYAVEMVEAKDGELLTVPLESDLRPQQVIDYPSDAYQLLSPILGVGCTDVCCDADDAIIVQSWFHTSPFSDGHEWLLDCFAYRGAGEGFVKLGRASMAGTGLGPDDLQELIRLVRDTGAPSKALEGLSEQDYWKFNTLMLADGDPSLHLVTRMEATDDAYGTGSYERQEQIYNETHEDWCDPQLLGTFTTSRSSNDETDMLNAAKENEDDVPDAQALFSATLDDLKAQAQANDFFGGLFYQFADLDGDGVDELFVSYLSGSWSESTNLIYKLQDGEVVRVFEYVRRGGSFVRCYPQTSTVVFQMTYKAMVYTWHYRYEDGTLVQRAAELDGRNYNGSLGYEGAEGVEATSEEYRAVVSELENGDAIELSLESSW